VTQVQEKALQHNTKLLGTQERQFPSYSTALVPSQMALSLDLDPSCADKSQHSDLAGLPHILTPAVFSPVYCRTGM
jgi:hypothetical protein